MPLIVRDVHVSVCVSVCLCVCPRLRMYGLFLLLFCPFPPSSPSTRSSIPFPCAMHAYPVSRHRTDGSVEIISISCSIPFSQSIVIRDPSELLLFRPFGPFFMWILLLFSFHVSSSCSFGRKRRRSPISLPPSLVLRHDRTLCPTSRSLLVLKRGFNPCPRDPFPESVSQKMCVYVTLVLQQK